MESLSLESGHGSGRSAGQRRKGSRRAQGARDGEPHRHARAYGCCQQDPTFPFSDQESQENLPLACMGMGEWTAPAHAGSQTGHPHANGKDMGTIHPQNLTFAIAAPTLPHFLHLPDMPDMVIGDAGSPSGQERRRRSGGNAQGARCFENHKNFFLTVERPSKKCFSWKKRKSGGPLDFF